MMSRYISMSMRFPMVMFNFQVIVCRRMNLRISSWYSFSMALKSMAAGLICEKILEALRLMLPI